MAEGREREEGGAVMGAWGGEAAGCREDVRVRQLDRHVYAAIFMVPYAPGWQVQTHQALPKILIVQRC